MSREGRVTMQYSKHYTRNYFDYLVKIIPDIDEVYLNKRQTKILCSIGPAARSIPMLESLIEAGMNMARICYTNYEYDKETIQNIRIATEHYSQRLGRACNVLVCLDLVGAEVRVGWIECGLPYMILKVGEVVKLTTEETYKDRCNNEVIYVDYPHMPQVVNIGDEIYLNQGVILMEVIEIADLYIKCLVKQGGKYSARHYLNFPKVILDLPDITEYDWRCIEFAMKVNVDVITISNIRHPSTVEKLRKALGDKADKILILSKIESREALPVFDDIANISDGILIGRNDLGINVTIPKLTYYQKKLIAKCNKLGRPVLVAAHILNTMDLNIRPKQNEVCDAANCVIDGADGLVLHNQTIVGKHPLETVVTLAKIIGVAETNVWKARTFNDFCKEFVPPVEGIEAMAMATADCAIRVHASAILVVTRTGRSCTSIVKYWPRCPLFGITRNEYVAKKMCLYRGIEPIIAPPSTTDIFIKDMEHQLQYAVDIGLNENYIEMYSTVVALVPSERGACFANSLVAAQITPKRKKILY